LPNCKISKNHFLKRKKKSQNISLINTTFGDFSGQLCQPGVPNKDPTVWLGGARLANTYILPSFPGYASAQPYTVQTPKNTFTNIKKFAVKIAKSYNRTIYNLAIILFSNGASQNSFAQVIVLWSSM
jgi:hypothetical protein